MILSLLIKGEKTTLVLLSELQAKKKVTKQGFYAALRKLREEETILIYKSIVSLNTVWIKRMKDSLADISHAYTVKQDSFDVLNLEDKESITYSFSNIRNLDTFWGHSQNILMYNTAQTEPIYAYDPHYWFYIARKETEQALLKEITENKRQFLMVVGNNYILDKVIAPDFKNDYLQYHYEPLFPRQDYYMTVIGDYISEVFLDEATADKIHELYASAKGIDVKVIEMLHMCLHAKVRSKIKISRNANRAQKLKKMLGKNFYIIHS